VILVSSRLGLRTVQALLDASPEGTPEKVKARVEAVDRVLDCHAIRVRHAGPQYFVDLHITLDGALPLREAHAVTERVEKAVEEILPGADVTVHPEPSAAPGSPAHPDHTRNPQPKTELRKGPSKG